MRPSLRVLLTAVALCCGASWVVLEAAPEPLNGPVAVALDKPLHWSAQPPKLAPGLQVIQSWFISFGAPDGRTIPARIFLIERRQAPSRIICLGHEIETTDPYTPDFEVQASQVKPMGTAMFRVSLGNLEAFVRTAVQPAK